MNQRTVFRSSSVALLAVLGCALSVPAMAQSSSSSSSSLLPFTKKGYVGLNIGRPRYDLSCGAVATMACDDPKASFHIYTGGMFSENFGVELGYLNTGSADRAGGTTKAQGLNASLVARVPLGEKFSAFAKGGGTWGRTEVTANPLSGIATGKVRGTGGSYGAGLGYDFTTSSSIVLEWQQHDFHFAGVGRQPVKSTSIGFVQRF